MGLQITPAEALWFLPFMTPLCLWVMWSDLSAMRIPNPAVLAMTAVFVAVGLIALPLAEYPWRLLTIVVVLVLMFLANMVGLMGAGDSKFIAAAAPFVDPGDIAPLCLIFAACLLAAYVSHRLAKHSPLRRLAPNWTSWDRGRKFPMGFALGGTMVIYLALGATG